MDAIMRPSHCLPFSGFVKYQRILLSSTIILQLFSAFRVISPGSNYRVVAGDAISNKGYFSEFTAKRFCFHILSFVGYL